MKKTALLLSIIILISTVFCADVDLQAAQEINLFDEGNFIVKDDMELYSNNLALSSAGWKSNMSDLVSLSLECENTSRVYGGSGRSLRADFVLGETDTRFNFYLNDKIINENSIGEPLGYSSKLGFWLYSDCDVDFYLVAYDSNTGKQVRTTTVSLNTGANFLIYDWTDFNNDTGVFEYIYQPVFVFIPQQKQGTVWLDQIGIIAGDAQSTHAEGFYELAIDNTAFNAASANASLCEQNATVHHRGITNVGANTYSIRLDYTQISTDKSADYCYSDCLRINSNDFVYNTVSDNLYGEDTVLSFWVKSGTPISLELWYYDTNIYGEEIESEKFITAISAGESIINVPLKEIMKNKKASYSAVDELHISLYGLSKSDISGCIYIDAIGFYSTNTDNILIEKISKITEISPEYANEISDIIYFYTELSVEEENNITNKTLSRYNNLISKFYLIAPQITYADTLNGDSNYKDGTLAFDISLKNPELSGYRVKKIGAVVHRKQLLAKPYMLTGDTENSVTVSKFVSSSIKLYEEKLILKCFDGASSEDFEGYIVTDYLVRPFAVFTTNGLDEHIVYGSVYDTSSKKTAVVKENIEKMTDQNSNTAWVADSPGKHMLSFKFDTPKTFNTIVFKEVGSKITDYIVELKQENEWVQVYRQDQMGSRTGVLDKTYTAKEVRLTVTTNDAGGGIKEIEFALADGFADMSGFANVGYYTASRMDKVRAKNYSELHGLTDIIFFDYGSFTVDGDFLWGKAEKDTNGIYNEQLLKEVMAETVKELDGEPMRMWFSLGNYYKETTTDNALLFATEEARQKLAEFCVELCDEYGFYGIELDYEFPDRNTDNPDLAWENFNKFLRCAGAALHAKGYKLSAALPGRGGRIEAETVSYMDRVNAMVYDSRDARGNHSPYERVINSINYYTGIGFDRSQIIIGLPFYEHPTTDNSSGMTYEWVVKRWRNAIEPWTNIAYSGDTVHYFNGTLMIRDKVFYCMQQGIGGVFCWVMGADVPDDDPRSLSLMVEKTIERFTK